MTESTNVAKLRVRAMYPRACCERVLGNVWGVFTGKKKRKHIGTGMTPRDAWANAYDHVNAKRFAHVLTA